MQNVLLRQPILEALRLRLGAFTHCIGARTQCIGDTRGIIDSISFALLLGIWT